MPGRPVIGAEHVERASRRGRRHIEVLPGSIVTDQARDSAARLRIALRSGPLDRPAVPAPDGTAALVRGLYRRGAKWMPPGRPRGRNPVRFGRLAVVGAGGVGANVAHLAANAGMADEIVLVDIVPGLAEALALDLVHASGLTRSRSAVSGGTDLALVAGADVVVVTAGRPRAPGMDRADLREANRRTVRAVAETIRTAAPGAVVVVVSNPLDEMTAEMLLGSEFPRERVLGMAGTLDSRPFPGCARARGGGRGRRGGGDGPRLPRGGDGARGVPRPESAARRSNASSARRRSRLAWNAPSPRAGGWSRSARPAPHPSPPPTRSSRCSTTCAGRGRGRCRSPCSSTASTTSTEWCSGCRASSGRAASSRSRKFPRRVRAERARPGRRRGPGPDRGRRSAGGGERVTVRSASGGGRFEEIGSYVRAKRVGPLVFVAGTTAIEPSGRLHAPGDTYAQTI